MHHCPQCYCTPHLSGHNKSDRHESQHSRSAAKIVKLVPAEKLKSTLDSVYGYHGVEQAEKDCYKTTFATEWVMFMYLLSRQLRQTH